MRIGGVIMTKKCKEGRPHDDILHHSPWCVCKGTGRVLTKDGERLIKLVQTYGGFAEENHTHSIS